ncbi:MAG UNVERIFIED_CONTAM: hypothetical protein LVR18_11065 [Planctomycetaceae bacterium]
MRGEAGEESFHLISTEVTVGISGKQNIGCGTDQQPIPPHGDSRWKRQALQKDKRLIEAAVGVGIEQAANASTRLARAFRISLWIVSHFCCPDAAHGIKSDGYGTLQEWFGRGQLHAKATRSSQRPQ